MVELVHCVVVQAMSLLQLRAFCSGDGNLDRFIDAGGLCGVGRFCDTGVSGCDGGRGG